MQRFGRPTDCLASLVGGEGIETMLVIAPDSDAVGEHAAERLARRCARARVAATVVVPEGDDFDALAARLAPAVRAIATAKPGRRHD